MRIKKITHHKNQPISYDEFEIETIDGNKYYLLDCEIEELLKKKKGIEGGMEEDTEEEYTEEGPEY